MAIESTVYSCNFSKEINRDRSFHFLKTVSMTFFKDDYIQNLFFYWRDYVSTVSFTIFLNGLVGWLCFTSYQPM